MLRLERVPRNRLVGRWGGGPLMAFGLLFALFGSMPLLAATGILGSANGKAPPVLPLLLVGGLFVSVGLCIALGRRGLTIERGRNTVTTWYGLLVPMFRKERGLAEFTQVTLTAEIRRNKNSSYTVYPVRLAADGKPVLVEEPRDYLKSRQAGEMVAKYLTLPLADCTSGSPVVREASELDEPLASRMRRKGEPVVLPSAPATAKARVLRKDRAVMLEIPAPGFNPLLAILPGLVLVPVVMFLGFFLFMIPGNAPAGIRYGFPLFVACMVLIPATVGLLGFLRRTRTRTRVTVSASGLRCERLGFGGTKTEEIALDKLEELEMQSSVHSGSGSRGLPNWLSGLAGGGMVARSDECSLEFGGHLDVTEKQFLLAVLRQAVLDNSGPSGGRF